MKEFIKNILIAAIGAAILFIVLAWFDQYKKSTNTSLGLRKAMVMQQEFYNAAYSGITNAPIDGIAGMFVNHHLLAPHLIAKQFVLAATDKPITVVLVSPNHFYSGQGGFIASKYTWQTPFGELNPDLSIIDQLSDIVNIDETPFKDEHGIGNIVGFIKKSLPNAKIVPIMIKENVKDADVDSLATKLEMILPKGSIIVGSFDFSHYLNSNAAIFHDIQTLSTIRNFDLDRTKKLDTDSHPGLRLILKYLDLTGNRRFILNSHENSATVSGNYSFTETTSYINGYFIKGDKDMDTIRTALYYQGLPKSFESSNPLDPRYMFQKSDRLFLYNDRLLTTKPSEIEFLPLADRPIAVGVVFEENVAREIFVFPLEINDGQVKLLSDNEVDTILKQMGDKISAQMKIK
jgi:AmmeMemoRadiSam system protein B